jgi:hypothetical protein
MLKNGKGVSYPLELYKYAKRFRSRRSRWTKSKSSEAESVKLVEKLIREALGVPEGAHWVCREGDLTGPDNPRIAPWCEGVGGIRSERGIWHPAQALGEGRVLWKRLIYPKEKPTELEMLAEVGMGMEE